LHDKHTTFFKVFNPADYPFLILIVSLAAFWLSSSIGWRLGRKVWRPQEHNREDFKFVVGGTLTLLGLIIGFTFSMAVGRYDQRKNCEEDEANAIGTEYLRADLLPVSDAANLRSLLTNYVAERLCRYTSQDKQQRRQIEADTAALQNQMWSTASASAEAHPTPLTALVVAGMNDVINSQGYTHAAWRNRVPIEAWALLGIISIFCNLMIGNGAQGRTPFLLLILPVVLSISLFLIADIDSPRGGLIRVRPQNLESLSESLHPTKNP
jgi:hypothetical protein